jgi:hypothetical protein
VELFYFDLHWIGSSDHYFFAQKKTQPTYIYPRNVGLLNCFSQKNVPAHDAVINWEKENMDAPPPAADRSEKEEKQYTSRCMHATNK